jgi:hypothetical protein
MKKIFLSIFSAAILLAQANTFAQSTSLSKDEAKLIGAWQLGLTPKVKSMNAAQIKELERTGSLRLGGVIQFNADHSFTIFFSCGPKEMEIRKMGITEIKGNWELSSDGELSQHMSAQGKQRTLKSFPNWKDDLLTLANQRGQAGDQHGKYDGPLPITCGSN